MELKLNNFFGNSKFYKATLSIAIPIMIQNGITNFVNLIDNIMVGSVGTIEMSAVSIINKLIFVYNLCIFGGSTGVGIFTTQYYGKKDYDGIKKCFRLKLYTNLLAYMIIMAILLFFGDNIIMSYLSDTDSKEEILKTFGFAKQYLYIIFIGMVPQVLTEAFSSTLRETSHTKLPMFAGGTAVFTNLLLNYILIYGKFGFPVMGVKGAAIATVISKYIELLVIVVVVTINKRYSFIYGVFKKLSLPISFIKMVLPKSLPLLFNEAGWSIGMAALASCYATRGIMVVAGYSISSTITDIFNIVSLAMGTSIAIIVGNLLGANKLGEAKITTTRLITFSVLLSVVLAAVLFVTAPLFPLLYSKTAPEAREFAANFLRIYSGYLVINTITGCCYFTIRSGGKTLITFLLDSVFMLGVSVPFSFVLAHFTSLPILPLYALSLSIDLIKVVAGLMIIAKGKWMQNIVD